MRKLIALGVVVFLLLVNTVVTDRQTKDAEASHGSKIIELDGGDLNYKEEGGRDDPTIVLLHGFACSLRWWDRVAPELARRGLHVIRFDLLGHGGSEMPRDGYEMETAAAKIVELEGGDLYYKEAGERDDPTIVLLHGFACSQRWWDRVRSGAVAPRPARDPVRPARSRPLGDAARRLRDGRPGGASWRRR